MAEAAEKTDFRFAERQCENRAAYEFDKVRSHRALDFVGHHRSEFRFDQRFRALTGFTRARLEREVEHGFPFLPSGTQIVLDEQTQRAVLRNLRSQLPTRTRQLTSELRALGNVELATFLAATGLGLSDLLRPTRSWTDLRRNAGVEHRPVAGSDTEAYDAGVIGLTPLVLDLWAQQGQKHAEAVVQELASPSIRT